MEKHLPVRLLLVPPLLSSAVVGFGAGLVAFGVALKDQSAVAYQIAMIWSGSGTILGFLWGATIWMDKMAGVYEMRVYGSDTRAVDNKPAAPVRVELRDEGPYHLGIEWLDLPGGITLEQLVETAKLVVRNDYNFGHYLCGAHKPLQRGQLEALRDLMVSKDLMRWNNPHARNQGLRLLPSGRQLFRQLATYPEKPLPKLLSVLR